MITTKNSPATSRSSFRRRTIFFFMPDTQSANQWRTQDCVTETLLEFMTFSRIPSKSLVTAAQL